VRLTHLTCLSAGLLCSSERVSTCPQHPSFLTGSLQLPDPLAAPPSSSLPCTLELPHCPHSCRLPSPGLYHASPCSIFHPSDAHDPSWLSQFCFLHEACRGAQEEGLLCTHCFCAPLTACVCSLACYVHSPGPIMMGNMFYCPVLGLEFKS
jgi:hypothetical protein